MVKTKSNAATAWHEDSSNVVHLQTSGLSPEVQDGLIAYCNRKLDNLDDVIHHDDIAKVAFYKTIEHGLLSLFLYDVESNRFFFNEGYFHDEIRALLKNYIHRLNEKNSKEIYTVYIEERLYNLELRLNVHESKKYIFGAITPESHNRSNAITPLEELFSRYYLVDSLRTPALFEYNCFPLLNRILREASEKAKRSDQKLHYILIEIEPLKKYIKVAGDYMVNEVLKNVQETIALMVKDNGSCYILNSSQFFITAFNFDEKTIKEKFGHAHLRIKNLLLIYQMNYYEVTDFDNGYLIENAWPHLKTVEKL